MNQQILHSSKHLFRAGITILLISFSIQGTAVTSATTAPESGSYCPGTDILLIVAEELSASLDLVMDSIAALINNDQATAISKLSNAGTTLRLAASRGAAARSILLIDALIQARAGEDYAQMLTWFPLLHTSLSTLPDNTTQTATIDLIDRAEDIMQGGNGGDPLELLNEARHMLACDGLDIPLQEAMKAQDALMNKLKQNTKNSAYDTLLNALRSTLVFALGKK